MGIADNIITIIIMITVIIIIIIIDDDDVVCTALTLTLPHASRCGRRWLRRQ